MRRRTKGDAGFGGVFYLFFGWCDSLRYYGLKYGSNMDENSEAPAEAMKVRFWVEE